MPVAHPSASIEADEKLAKKLDLQFRANPKRNIASLYATKAVEHDPNNQQTLGDDIDSSESSRLSTPPESRELSVFIEDSRPTKETEVKISIPIVEDTRRIRGLTNITVDEADAMSHPPPGDELLQLAEGAKQRQEIPKLFDTSVLRFIDRKWMAPQMCDGYVHGLHEILKSCMNPTDVHIDARNSQELAN